VTSTSQHLDRATSPSDVKRTRISLGLGAAVVVDTPSSVRTVLGSCVAIILHVPRLGVSALCHAQMPEREAGVCCSDACPRPCEGVGSADSNDLRYVACSIRYMLGELRRRQARNSEIVCTLVGGANVLRNVDPRWSVANRNVDTARAILEKEGIRVAYSDTGGTRGRVIEHISDLNRTQVKYHDPS
jgi:chemotaxis protein CheD